MALYDFTSGGLQALPATTFPAIGTKEREHLQAALRDAITTITPGAETMVLAEEYGDWEGVNRRIDLLCLDSDGCLVVVELKRHDASHMELQALRYAAMISSMRFDQAVEAHRVYLSRRGKDTSTAEADIRSFLGAAPDEPVALQDVVRIVLAAGEFSTEVTTTVLWLNSAGLDIRCVQMQPYKVGDLTLVDIEQIIPLPQAAEYQVAIREKTQAQAAAAGGSSRDNTKFDLTIAGQPTLHGLNKRALMFHLIRAAIAQGLTPEQLQQAYPRQSGDPALYTSAPAPPQATSSTFSECFPGKDEIRFFSKPDQLIFSGGNVYAITNQWGTRTVANADAILCILPHKGAVSYEPLLDS